MSARKKWNYRLLKAEDWKLTLKDGVAYTPPLGGKGGPCPPESIDVEDDDNLVVTFKNDDVWEIRRRKK
jgi:hypothetical protein